MARWLAFMLVGLTALTACTPSRSSSDPGIAGLGYQSVADGSVVHVVGSPMGGFPAAVPGTVRVVNLWAVWCGPCAQEAPVLHAAQAELKPDHVQFISVNANDSESKASAFAHQHGWSWAQDYDANGATVLAQHFTGMPDTLILRADGVLDGYFLGPIPNVKALAAAVRHAET